MQTYKLESNKYLRLLATAIQLKIAEYIESITTQFMKKKRREMKAQRDAELEFEKQQYALESKHQPDKFSFLSTSNHHFESGLPSFESLADLSLDALGLGLSSLNLASLAADTHSNSGTTSLFGLSSGSINSTSSSDLLSSFSSSTSTFTSHANTSVMSMSDLSSTTMNLLQRPTASPAVPSLESLGLLSNLSPGSAFSTAFNSSVSASSGIRSSTKTAQF